MKVNVVANDDVKYLIGGVKKTMLQASNILLQASENMLEASRNNLKASENMLEAAKMNSAVDITVDELIESVVDTVPDVTVAEEVEDKINKDIDPSISYMYDPKIREIYNNLTPQLKGKLHVVGRFINGEKPERQIPADYCKYFVPKQTNGGITKGRMKKSIKDVASVLKVSTDDINTWNLAVRAGRVNDYNNGKWTPSIYIDERKYNIYAEQDLLKYKK